MRLRSPLILAVATAVALGLVLNLLLDQEAARQRRSFLDDQLHNLRTRLEGDLQARLLLAKGLAAYVLSIREVSDASFQRFSRSLTEGMVGVHSLQLAPQGTVGFVTQLGAHAVARGTDLLADAEPVQRARIRQAMRSGALLISSPRRLESGDLSLIAHQPIFDEPENSVHFWGFASVDIDLGSLLAAERLRADPSVLSYALRDGSEQLGPAVFFGAAETFAGGSVTELRLGNQSWQLGAKLRPGVQPGQALFDSLRVAIVLLAGLLGWLLFLRLRSPAKPHGAETASPVTGAMLERSQRMEAIGQLTSGVAHDFNNLLAVILGNLDLLRYRQSSDEGRETIDHAISAAERGAHLTNSLLAFSRKQSLDPEVFDFNELVSAMLTMLRSSAGEAIRLHARLAPSLSYVMADRPKMENALLSLVLNAREAIRGGGEITIRTRDMTGKDGRAMVELSVSDSGEGMSEEVRAQAFEPFFTTKKPPRGSGLGLSMISTLVQQSGGEIALESAPEQGSTVFLRLPACMTGAPIPAPAQAPERSPPAPLVAGDRLLLVEDDSRVRAVLQAQLQQLGYAVTVVPEAAAAIATLESSTDFTVMLTDVVMPGDIDGLQLGTQVEERFPEVVVIYMSGHHGVVTAPRDREAILLEKPFRIRELSRALERACARARQRARGG